MDDCEDVLRHMAIRYHIELQKLKIVNAILSPWQLAHMFV